MRAHLIAKSTPPAFQFYPGDWLASTLGMPWDVKGVYVDFLCWAWKNGPLPDDPEWRQRVIGADAKTVARIWTALRPRWKKTARGWINARLERQREIQLMFRERGEKGAAAKQASSRPQAGAKRLLASSPQAGVKQVLNAWPSSSSSSSSSEDQEQPAAKRPVLVPWKIYVAIAKQAFKEATNDLADVAEVFKKKCAQQGFAYDAALTSKALNAASAARKRA